MEPQRALIGSWLLRGWTVTDDRGVTHPFGTDPVGSIMYSADGRMSALISRGDRSPLPGNRPSDASDAELAAGFLSFFCYTGPWRVDGDTVIHTLEVALNPNLVGTEQRRQMVFEGDRLDLVAVEQTPVGPRRHVISWQHS